MTIAAASFDGALYDSGAADPARAHALRVLGLAERQLADAADRLASTGAQARPLADDTNWQTDAATRFHASVEVWRDDVNTLSVLAEAARDDVRRARVRIEASAGGLGA